MKRIVAFLTLENREGFHIDDHLTVDPLRKLGWNVVEIPWDRSGVDWSEFDAVVIRSTWDYQHSPKHFLRVLSEIDNSGTVLFNPSKICRWNLDKIYLRELATQGIPIVPTRWLDSLDQAELGNAFNAFKMPQIVAKPTIGANAGDAFVLKLDEPEAWQAALEVFDSKPLMLQPFIESVVEHGEYSLFYFGGQFSHAILKQPKPGDFRVQEDHGGSIRPVTVDDSLSRVAAQVIDALDEELLYARVDLVRLDDGQPVLIELELIEPSLYFQEDPASSRRFAEALDRFASSACS